MISEGSTAWRGVTELVRVLESYYDVVPERLYMYADGGGDRRDTFLKVMMGLIAVCLKLDLDELISARPAAGHSFRNPVEVPLNCKPRVTGCGDNAAVNETRRKKTLKSLNSTDEIRRAFKSHPQLESCLEKSL